ncbi:MAG TPA: hypothetical protein VMU37_07020, partial [Caulobacteraceae bacterium]|nr:hypothetical protein [Caulobacteraceae bacterium]
LADLNDPDAIDYLSPDGQRVLTTSGGYTLWTADGKRIESLPAPPASDPDVQASPAFSSGGRLLAIPAAGGADIWDSLTGELIRRLRSGSELPIGLMFSSDGRKLAIAFGQTVQVWDPISGERPAGVFSTAPDEVIREARFSASGDRLLATTTEHAGTKPLLGSWIWSLPDGRRLARVQNLMQAGASDDGSVVVGLSDGLVEIYGGDGSEACHTPAPQLDELHPVISPDAKAVLVLGETDLQLFAPASTDTTICDRLVAEKLQSHTDEITSATFSADSEDVLTSSQDGTARLWRIGGPVGGLPSRVYPPGALFQGGYFAARSGDSWGVFDAVTGKPVAMLQGVRMPISRFAVSADRRRVATFAGHALTVWDAANGARLTSLDTGADGVLDFALSPQGDRVAIAYQDRTGELIDLSSGRRIAALAHSGNLASVDFSADGRRLVTSAEQTAQVWDGRTGRPIGKPMTANNSRSADDNRIDSAELSADGRRVLITTQGATASLWTVGSVEPSAVLRNGTRQVTSASFTPDGRRVVTMGTESEGVSVWDAASGQLLISHDGGDDLAVDSAPHVAPSNVAIVLAAGQDRFEWPARFYYGQALVKQACGRLARDFTPEERRTYGVNHAQAYCRGQNFPWPTQR